MRFDHELFYAVFGKAIRSLRRKRGWSQESLLASLKRERSKKWIRDLEHGRTRVYLDEFYDLSLTLGQNPLQLASVCTTLCTCRVWNLVWARN